MKYSGSPLLLALSVHAVAAAPHRRSPALSAAPPLRPDDAPVVVPRFLKGGRGGGGGSRGGGSRGSGGSYGGGRGSTSGAAARANQDRNGGGGDSQGMSTVLKVIVGVVSGIVGLLLSTFLFRYCGKAKALEDSEEDGASKESDLPTVVASLDGSAAVELPMAADGIPRRNSLIPGQPPVPLVPVTTPAESRIPAVVAMADPDVPSAPTPVPYVPSITTPAESLSPHRLEQMLATDTATASQ